MTGLAAERVSVVFPGRRGRRPARAVDGVDLVVEPGEIVALVGESGCGKSTMARALVGLVKPTSGRIVHDDQPLRYRSRELRRYRRTVQLVLQDPGGALNPRQTIFDAVAEGPRLHGLRDGLTERVHGALSRAGLRPPEQFVDRYPHELSGGQQQRVVIAGALALDPTVLVADEPVASLDASVRGEILALLLRLRDDLGLSALVVSHDLGLAWNIADRVAVMYLGRIVELGTVEEVLLDPLHPYTQALISVVPDAHRSHLPALIPGEPPDPTDIPSGCRFHPRCPRRRALAEEGTDTTACTTQDPAVLAASGPRQVACHFTSDDHPAGKETSCAS